MDTNDFTWHIPPPGDLLPKERISYYKTSLDWRHITAQTIGRWRRFLPSKRIVLKEVGRPVDELDNVELAKFIIKRIKEKKDTESLVKGVTKSVEGKKQGRRDLKIDDLMAEYLNVYEAKTPNDLDSLRQLCSLKLAINDLENTERQMLTGLKDPNSRGKYTESFINSIVNARTKYLAEYRQLQTMLGIDRQSREKAESETGGTEYMRQLVHSASNLLESKSVPIRCPKCPTENSSLLNMGFVLSHFGKWKFEGVCPKCGSPILLSGAVDP